MSKGDNCLGSNLECESCLKKANTVWTLAGLDAMSTVRGRDYSNSGAVEGGAVRISL